MQTLDRRATIIKVKITLAESAGFCFGVDRAAKLIDYMAEMNVVGEYAGSKPREVLWTEQFFAEYKMRALEDQPID